MYITVLAPSPLCPFFHLFPSDPAVLGSADMLSDEYIDKEDNGAVLEFLMRYLKVGGGG